MKKTEETTLLMFHDDDCGELLDMWGKCPKCDFSPDMQSTSFKRVPNKQLRSMLRNGHTFLGQYRESISK